MLKKFGVGICIIVIVMSLCWFSACSVMRYNAVFYNDVETWINEDFIAEHRTANACIEYDVWTDDSLPFERVFLVNEDAALNDIFNENFDLKVDFKNDMIVIYTFTTPENHANTRLAEVNLNGHQLELTYKTPIKFGVGDAHVPMQQWFLVKLDKLDVDSAIFSDGGLYFL